MSFTMVTVLVGSDAEEFRVPAASAANNIPVRRILFFMFVRFGFVA
jgi:hypothetical protein